MDNENRIRRNIHEGLPTQNTKGQGVAVTVTFLKVPVPDTEPHTLLLLHLIPLPPCCELGLCQNLLWVSLLSVLDHAAGVEMELFGLQVLGSFLAVELEVPGVLLVLELLVVLDNSS